MRRVRRVRAGFAGVTGVTGIAGVAVVAVVAGGAGGTGGAGGAGARLGEAEAVDLSIVALTRNEERRVAKVMDEVMGLRPCTGRRAPAIEGREYYLWGLVVIDIGSWVGAAPWSSASRI